VQTRSGDSVGFPPSQFDDYEVVRPLGAGGMGTVFLGLLGSAAFDDYRKRIPFGAMSPGFGGFGGGG